jgi:hypothetical protein
MRWHCSCALTQLSVDAADLQHWYWHGRHSWRKPGVASAPVSNACSESSSEGSECVGTWSRMKTRRNQRQQRAARAGARAGARQDGRVANDTAASERRRGLRRVEACVRAGDSWTWKCGRLTWIRRRVRSRFLCSACPRGSVVQMAAVRADKR